MRSAPDWLFYGVVGLLCASGAVNVLLARRLLRAPPSGSGPFVRAQALPPEGPAPGTPLGVIPGTAPDGRQMQLNLRGGPPSVLLVLSPDCHWCSQSMGEWRALVHRYEGRARFVAIAPASSSGVRRYLEVNDLPAEIVENVPRSFCESKRMNLTPETILVGRDGVVKAAWVGYDPSLEAKVGLMLSSKTTGRGSTPK